MGAASYDHTQRGIVHRVVVGSAVVMLLAAIAIAVATPRASEQGRTVATCLAGGSLLLLLIAGAITWLRVHDDGDALRVAFGPLPLFRRRVPFDAIRAARPIALDWRHGIGIHLAPGGGWTWNVAKGAAVELELERGRWIVGSDDAEALAAFVNRRIAAGPARLSSRSPPSPPAP